MMYLIDGKKGTEHLRSALSGGVTIVQFRDKHPDDTTEERARASLAVARAASIPLVVNDDIHLAKRIGADGVHLGQDDGPIADAKELLGDEAIVGRTAHNLEEALEAEREGADYLGVGAVFATTSKIVSSSISPNALEEIARTVSIPVYAIGGIDAENISFVNGRGLHGVAVIGAIANAEDPREAAKKLTSRFRKELDYEAAIVDLDGTILDSNGVWTRVDLDFLARRNLTAPENYHKTLAGMGLHRGAAYIKELFDLPESPDEIIDELLREVEEIYREEIELRAGAREMLAYLYERKIPMVVATMNADRLFRPCLTRLGIDKYFCAMLSGEDVTHNKNHPEIYEKALEILGSDAKKTLLFEDILEAVRTGNGLGLITVAIDDPKNSEKPEELMQAADVFLEKPGDFPGCFLEPCDDGIGKDALSGASACGDAW